MPYLYNPFIEHSGSQACSVWLTHPAEDFLMVKGTDAPFTACLP